MEWISERKKIENKVYEKLKEIEKLEKKMWSERQPKKKLELREQIIVLKQKLEE